MFEFHLTDTILKRWLSCINSSIGGAQPSFMVTIGLPYVQNKHRSFNVITKLGETRDVFFLLRRIRKVFALIWKRVAFWNDRISTFREKLKHLERFDKSLRVITLTPACVNWQIGIEANVSSPIACLRQRSLSDLINTKGLRCNGTNAQLNLLVTFQKSVEFFAHLKTQTVAADKPV